MINRRQVRAAIALIAAYAVALQTILLVLAVPLPATAAFAARPICAASARLATGSVPADHPRDCLVACLTGCCGGASALPPLRAANVVTPQAARAHAPPIVRVLSLPPPVTGAHRSRAPPRV